MSIKDRLDDGALLAQQGRLDGAVLMAFVAVAATARKRYPSGSLTTDGKRYNDKSAFEQFIADVLPSILGASKPVAVSVSFRGRQFAFGEMLYNYGRCALIHEGVVGPQLFFEYQSNSLLDKKGQEECIWVSSDFIGRLAVEVANAPENRAIFPRPGDTTT